MNIQSLELKQFRNYDDLHVEFDQGINILYGDNAQGKTNILEAIYVCATTKSHRMTKDKDMIRFGMDESHIRMYVEKNKIQHKIDMHLKKNKSKGVAIDGMVIKKSSQLFGVVNTVFFSPEDLGIIKNGPSERRRFIDMELCQLNPVYLYNISQYQKILEQRNNLLKQLSWDRTLIDTLDIWDIQLLDYGEKIIECRTEFVRKLEPIMTEIHSKLSGGREKLSVAYEPNTLIEEFESKLKQRRDYDIKIKTTTAGPHRDDIGFQIHGIDVRKFGSQGQQRTVALSLKLAEIQLVRQMIDHSPVLLLDDVLSELDSSRQNYLLESIRDIQTIITCTGLDEFIQNRFSVNRVHKVTNGSLELMNQA